jgi:hypothetical protein
MIDTPGERLIGRALGWHFATRLLPEVRPTVTKGGEGWQDGGVNSYLND